MRKRLERTINMLAHRPPSHLLYCNTVHHLTSANSLDRTPFVPQCILFPPILPIFPFHSNSVSTTSSTCHRSPPPECRPHECVTQRFRAVSLLRCPLEPKSILDTFCPQRSVKKQFSTMAVPPISGHEGQAYHPLRLFLQLRPLLYSRFKWDRV